MDRGHVFWSMTMEPFAALQMMPRIGEALKLSVLAITPSGPCTKNWYFD